MFRPVCDDRRRERVAQPPVHRPDGLHDPVVRPRDHLVGVHVRVPPAVLRAAANDPGSDRRRHRTGPAPPPGADPADPGGWRRARHLHPHRVRYPGGPADRAELLTEGEDCMRRKKGSDDAPATGARITPEEVQQVEFRLAFRGYNERDVDAFLDRITEGLSSYCEELEAMRWASGLPLAAVAG